MKTILFTIIAALLLCLEATSAQADATKAIALTLKVQGEVTLRKAGTDAKVPLKFGTPLDDGDWIRTGADGSVSIIFADDKSVIKLNSATEVTLNGKRDDQSNIAKRISMEVGEMFAKVEKQRGSLEVATPTSVASVKGTEFWTIVHEDGSTEIITLEGLVELMNRLSGQSVTVGEGETGNSDADGGVGKKDTPPGGVPQEDNPDAEPPKTIEINLNGPNNQSKTILIQYLEGAE